MALSGSPDDLFENGSIIKFNLPSKYLNYVDHPAEFDDMYKAVIYDTESSYAYAQIIYADETFGPRIPVYELVGKVTVIPQEDPVEYYKWLSFTVDVDNFNYNTDFRESASDFQMDDWPFRTSDPYLYGENYSDTEGGKSYFTFNAYSVITDDAFNYFKEHDLHVTCDGVTYTGRVFEMSSNAYVLGSVGDKFNSQFESEDIRTAYLSTEMPDWPFIFIVYNRNNLHALEFGLHGNVSGVHSLTLEIDETED